MPEESPGTPPPAATRHTRGDADAESAGAARASRRTPMAVRAAVRRPVLLPRRSAAWCSLVPLSCRARHHAFAGFRLPPRSSARVASCHHVTSAAFCAMRNWSVSSLFIAEPRASEAELQGPQALSVADSPCFPTPCWPFFCLLGPSIQIKHQALLEESCWHRRVFARIFLS